MTLWIILELIIFTIDVTLLIQELIVGNFLGAIFYLIMIMLVSYFILEDLNKKK